jgi:uncharacterized membrane protein YeaQ/YmgE (transglycosylase-associated protein family)
MRTPLPRTIGLAVLVSLCLASVLAAQEDGVAARVGEHEFRVTFGEIFTILSIGGLVGAVVGAIGAIRGKRFSPSRNLAIGIFGAIVGGILVDWIDIDVGLGDFSISYEQLVASYAGAFLLLLVIATVRKKRQRRA